MLNDTTTTDHEAREEAAHSRGRARVGLPLDLFFEDRLAQLQRGGRDASVHPGGRAAIRIRNPRTGADPFG